MMAAQPEERGRGQGGARRTSARAPPQTIYLTKDPGNLAASSNADTSAYTPLQTKAAELIAGTANIAQFLDRDTNPEFASNVMGDALADFIDDPSSIDSILSDVEDQKKVIFAS